MIAAIDAVNWSALPNPTWHDGDAPERVAHALRLLAVSTTANETGNAASLLSGAGFVCGHAAMVFPAAHAATPILLDLAEHGQRPRIRDVSVSLLSDALACFPPAGHHRVRTPYGDDVPLCCAIARHIRGRRSALLAHGRHGKQLLAEAGLHWRLTIEETERHPDGSLTALAVLEGAPFGTPVDAEVHTSPRAQPAPTAHTRIDDLTTDAAGAAYLHLGRPPAEPLPAGTVLYSAECGLRAH
ncbi:hypothetical protein ACH47Z_13870 [Streptomyces sp. NPDC020192]|uniref:hypothetical protein n=1 Tax=Streptomyces sp. NPDC020192 TaxID=3365066 RepID=UPI0037906EA8